MRIFLLALFLAAAFITPAAQRKEPLPERRPGGSGSEGKTSERAGSISRIRVKTLTGGDDLRRESRVSFFVVRRDGGRVQSPPLNCVTRSGAAVGAGDPVQPERCQRLADHTRRTFEWDLSRERPPLKPGDVHRFGVSFESGRPGPFDTGDNWNLDSLEVEYVVEPAEPGGRAATRQMLRLSGRPLYRFKTREEWESEPLQLGEGVPPSTLMRLPAPGTP